MTFTRSATLGFALALGAAGAHAQGVGGVVSRHVDNEPVETIVTQTPAGTVVTRRPLAAAPAQTTYVDETVGAEPAGRSTTRTTRRVVHHDPPHATTERTVTHTDRTHTERTTRHVVRSRPLALAPAQRQVIYRTIYRTLVQQQVVPQVAAAPPSVPGYPPFPPPAYPAYQPRTIVVMPATTGYGAATPIDDDEDDYAAAPVAAAQVYPVGAVLPANVAVAPLPARAAVAVPAAQPYRYATVDGRVLLVDPDTNTVVADITP